MDTEVIVAESALTDWRVRIEAAWQRSVASVIEVGKLVKQAKEELGVSFNLLETELPFSSTVAAFLIKIVENPVLSNPIYYARLPNSYNTLYHLTSVDEQQLVQKIESGEISPNYTLLSAKALRQDAPKDRTKQTDPNQPKRPTDYQVGTLSIPEPKNLAQFEADLADLLAKYNGTIAITHKENSLAEWHRKQLHQQAIEQIAASESQLTEVTLEELRMLEDAANYLQKVRNQKHKRELVINGELVERTCLPDDYKDYKALVQLLGREEIQRGFIKKYCVDNKIPNQFTEVSSIDKELYVWEQVRHITEKTDLLGGTKRLKDMATRSRIPPIKELAIRLRAEVNRFEKKA